MNKITLTLSLVITTLIITSCFGGGSSKKGDYLPPLKVEIPDAIKDDPKLVDLVKSSEKAINEFSNNMEQLVVDLEPYMDKEEEDLGTFDKLKIAKIGVDFLANSTNALAVIEKLELYSSIQEKEGNKLDDDHLHAIATVIDAFEKRMEQLDKKYQTVAEKQKKKEKEEE